MYDGGAVYTAHANLNLINSYLESNNILYNETYNGGAVYSDCEKITAFNSTFINNTKNAIYGFNIYTVILNNEFKNNGEAIHTVLYAVSGDWCCEAGE